MWQVKIGRVSLWFHLQLQLVHQWFPVQTEVAFLPGVESKLVELNHVLPLTLGRDLPIDGQSALVGWDGDPVTPRGEVDAQAQPLAGAPRRPAVVPGATKCQALVIFTWAWRKQKEVQTHAHTDNSLAKLFLKIHINKSCHCNTETNPQVLRWAHTENQIFMIKKWFHQLLPSFWWAQVMVYTVFGLVGCRSKSKACSKPVKGSLWESRYMWYHIFTYHSSREVT